MILDYLSPVDRVCLALCCHRLMIIVTRCGGKPLKGMLACEWGGEPDSEVSRFLARLSEDLPEYYNCCNCIQLYLWRNIPHPGSFQFDRICCKPGLKTRHWDGTNAAVWQLRDTRYRLDVAHVQTAIRRHLHEPQYGNSVDSLSYTDVRVPDLYGWDSPERSIFFRHHATQVTSIDARIFPNTARLCLRVQNLRIGREEFLEEKHKDDAVAKWGYFIQRNQCVHLKCIPQQFATSEISCARSRPSKYPQIPESLESKFVATCNDCPIHCTFEIRRLDGGYLPFVCTRYVDLGAGEVPSPYISIIPWSDDKDCSNQQSGFENCPDDGRAKRILSEEDSILPNIRLVTERKYEVELTRLLEDDGFWFERVDY